MNQVPTDCQDNLVRILRRAICDYGMNHIETARGYGCSELQLGAALRQLFESGVVKREDLIIQTKVAPFATAKEFRETLDRSLSLLQVDYVDLFAFHGMNMPHQYGWVFENGDAGNNMDVVKEYVAAGKIRHVGFSTHGPQDLIRRCIETDAFEYVNLHYHFCGSYTTTGIGPEKGNLGNLRLLNQKDMGVFVISPYDKGGKLYEPSNKLRSLILPDMEPMAFGSAWLWNHGELDGGKEPSKVHTIVCGAARPADLDQPAVAAYLQSTEESSQLAKVRSVLSRLETAAKEGHDGDTDWLETCYEGVPKSNTSKHTVEHNQIVWCYNVIKSYGLLQFAKDRYGSLEGNRSKWDDSLPTLEEKYKKVGLGGWGFVPGLSLVPGQDYSDDFEKVPEKNKEKVRKAEEFVLEYCAKRPAKKAKSNDEEKKDEGDGEKKKEEEETKEGEEPRIPFEWQTAYEMKPWADWPDRP
eukprot:CAMPEP_0116566432 /NCGR_PEP_ID=MMETSP0397-20121206/14461_1 /TAXON_ID=216820 /ORGANISM="Cyclophora tenuis, Strain ECT3854" /LENGTH=467 /DNA_ID=CAMNT_0004093337 /DNA_START=245 /DNA_END=1648 /DNA_ORIENTATION=+